MNGDDFAFDKTKLREVIKLAVKFVVSSAGHPQLSALTFSAMTQSIKHVHVGDFMVHDFPPCVVIKQSTYQ